MPKDGREYKFKLNIDNKSLQDITDQLSDALSQGAKEGWNRSTMSDAKNGLGEILKYGQKTAKQLSGELGDALDISDLSPKAKLLFDNLDAVLNVTNEITAAMKETGGSLEWMKQGVTLVDDMRNLKAAVEKLPLDRLDKMEAAMERMSTQFQGFFDALQVTQPDAFFKRFGDSAAKAVRHVEKIKARLEQASDFSDIKSAIDTGKDDAFTVEDFIDLDEKEIQEEYSRIKQTIQDSLSDILKIEQDYLAKKNKKKLSQKDKESLYKQANYQQAMGDLSAAYYSFEALQNHVSKSSGLVINIDTSEIKNAAQEAANLIKEAKGDLDNAIKGLGLKDIELSVVLPDAKSAEFSGKINEIINETQSQFNAKPIEVSLDFTNPIKTKRGKKIPGEENAKELTSKYTEIFNQIYTKVQDEAAENNKLTDVIDPLSDKQSAASAQKYMESFLKIVKMVTNSQDLLLEATKKWRNDMDEQLKLKFQWATDENEQDQKAALASLFHLANQVAQENPIFLKVDPDFLKRIETALNSKVFDIKANVGEVTGGISGGIPIMPVSGESFGSFTPPSSSAPIAVEVESNDDDNEEVQENTGAVKQSTQASRKSTEASNSLEKEVRALGQIIRTRKESAARAAKNVEEKQKIVAGEGLDQAITDKEAKVTSKQQFVAERNKLQQELEAVENSTTEVDKNKVNELKTLISALDKKINNVDSEISSFESELTRLRQEVAAKEKTIAQSESALHRDTSVANRATKRQQAIQKVLDNDSDPITLASNSLADFWKKSDRAMSSAHKNMSDVSKETTNMQNQLWKLESTLKNTEVGTEKYQELTNSIEQLNGKIAKNLESLSEADKKKFQSNVTRYSNAKAQQRYVENLGLQREIASEDLKAILKSNPTIAYDVANVKDKNLGFNTASQAMEDMGYFFNVVKTSMGAVSQSASEWENAKQAEQSLLNMVRTIKFIDEINKLLVETNRAPNIEDLQKFKQTYQHIPEMQGAIVAIDEYLNAIEKVSPLDKIEQVDEYLDQAIKQALGNLSNDDKSVVRAAFDQNGLKLDKSIKLKDLKEVYASGAFDNIDEAKLTTELRALINVLKTNSLYEDSAKKFNNVIKQLSSGKSYDEIEKGSKAGRDVSGVRQMPDGMKRAMRLTIDDSKPLAVKITDPGGNSKVIGLQRRNTAEMNADASYNTTSRGLSNFLKTYGLEDLVYEYLDLETVEHNLEAAVQMAANDKDAELEQTLQKQLENARKRRNEIYEQMFSSGWVSVTTNRDAFTKTSAQDYGFKDTEYGQNLVKKAKLEAEIARFDTMEDNEATRTAKAKKIEELNALVEILREQDNKLDAIHVLGQDIEIAKAKRAEAERNLNAYAVGTSVRETGYHKAGALTRGTGSLNTLLPYIETAKQHGTMSETVIAEIEDLFAQRQKDIDAFESLSSSEQEMRKGDYAKKLQSYKVQIAQKFYQTEGWYITELLTTSLNDAKRTFDSAVQTSDTNIADTKKTMGGQSAIAQLDRELDAEKAKINSNVDALINEMVNGPIEAVNDKLEADKQKAKQNKKKYTAPSDSEKDALYVQAINDYMLQQAQAQVSGARQKEKEQLQVQRERLLTEKSYSVENQYREQLKTDFDEQIKLLDKQYQDEQKAGKSREVWGKTFNEMMRLREEKQKRIRELTEEKYGKTDPQIVALDAQIAALEAEDAEAISKIYKPVTSVQEALAHLEEQRNNALEVEVKRHAAAVQQVLDSDKAAEGVIAQVNKTKQDAQAELDRAVQDRVKTLQTDSGSFKTDAAVKAEYDRQGKASAQAAFDAAQQNVQALEEKRDALVKEANASEEVLEAHRKATDAAKKGAEAAKQKKAATTSGGQGGGGYYGYPAGGFAINTSGLATESTLRLIYEALNGGAPVGGWEDSAQKLAESVSRLTAKIDESDIAPKAFNWKSMMQNASARKTEGAYLIGAYGQIGKTIQGTKTSVPHQKIVDALQQHVNEEILGILHNHPSGMSAFDRDDLIVAIQRAYSLGGYKDTKQIKSSGVIGGGKLTAIDFSNMTQEMATQVLHNFEDTLKAVTQGNPMFNWDDQGNLSIAQELLGDPESNAMIEKIFNMVLQSAFKSVGHADAFKQFDASNIDEFSKQLAAQAQQKVAETIVEQGAQTAVEAAAMPSQTVIDEYEKAEQAEVDKVVEELAAELGWNNEALKHQKAQSLDEELRKFAEDDWETYDDGYDYSLKHGIDRSGEDKIQQSEQELVQEIVDSAAQEVAQIDLSQISTDASKEVQNKILHVTNGFGDGVASIFDVTDLLLKAQQGIATPDELSQIAKAYEAFDNVNAINSNTKPGLNSIIPKLDEGIAKYVTNFVNEVAKYATQSDGNSAVAQQAVDQVAGTVVQKGAEAAKQVATQANITVDRDKLNKLNGELQKRFADEKAGKLKRPAGEAGFSIAIKNLSENLFKDYSALDTASADKQLKYLANDYLSLQKFIESEFYSGLKADTKQLIDEAMKSVKSVLDANGVKFAGDNDRLAGKVIHEALLKTSTGKDVLKSAQSTNPLKVGKIISSVKSPAILRNGRVLQEAKVYAHDPRNKEEKALVAEILGLEQKVAKEKKNQAEIDAQSVPNEERSAQAAKDQEQAERKTAEHKKNQKTNTAKPSANNPPSVPTPPAPPSGGGSSNGVGSGNTPQGGIIGILNQLAREDTLQSIAKLLSSKGGASGGSSGSGSTKEKDSGSILSDEEALEKLKEAAFKLPGVTGISNKSRSSATGHSLDVYRKELDKIETVTLSINKKTGEITQKTSFQQLAVGANAAEKELQKVDDLMLRLQNGGALQFDDSGAILSNNKAVDNYLQSLQDLRSYRDSLSTEELLDPKNNQRLNELTLTTQNYRKQVEALLKYTAQLGDGKILGALTDPSIVENQSQLKQAMIDMIPVGKSGETTFGDLKVVTDNLGNSYYELSYTMKTGKREVQEMTALFNPLTNEIIEQKGAVKEVQTEWDKLKAGFKAKFASLIQYTASITSIHSIINQVRKGIQHVREIDAALTELKKVTNETDITYDKFLQNMSKTAGVVGSTISELTTMAAEWARLNI